MDLGASRAGQLDRLVQQLAPATGNGDAGAE